MTIQNYILEGKKPKPVDNVIVWAKWYQGANRTVRKSKIRFVFNTIFFAMWLLYAEKEKTNKG